MRSVDKAYGMEHNSLTLNYSPQTSTTALTPGTTPPLRLLPKQTATLQRHLPSEMAQMLQSRASLPVYSLTSQLTNRANQTNAKPP
jgi:hypothetical protein